MHNKAVCFRVVGILLSHLLQIDLLLGHQLTANRTEFVRFLSYYHYLYRVYDYAVAFVQLLI
jgi:hypothetical protein